MKCKELKLREIQQEMLNTIVKIDDICNILNIKYSLAYGSLIGAIRHSGFIPWDDDLDIWMTKYDLDIFMDYCDNHAEDIKPFKLCSRKNIENYSYNIPRFANLEYEYVNTDEHQAMFDIGIFVDIYPIEGHGDSVQEATEIFEKCKRLNRLYSIYINPNSRKNIINTIAKKIISFGLHAIYKDKYYIFQEKEFDNLLTPYSKCKYVGCPRWTSNMTLYKKSDVFDKDGNFKTIKHTFEGVELNILENYDSILKEAYGDYMQLPPEEERHPYHSYKIYKRKSS